MKQAHGYTSCIILGRIHHTDVVSMSDYEPSHSFKSSKSAVKCCRILSITTFSWSQCKFYNTYYLVFYICFWLQGTRTLYTKISSSSWQWKWPMNPTSLSQNSGRLSRRTLSWNTGLCGMKAVTVGVGRATETTQKTQPKQTRNLSILKWSAM